MNYGMIFSLVQKGLQLIPTLISVGEDIAPIIAKLVKLVQSGKEGTVTDDDLIALEAELDSLIDSFNAPIP